MLTYTNLKNVRGYEQFKNNLSNIPTERIQLNIKKFDDFLNSNKKFFVAKDKSSRMNRDCIKEYRNLLNDALEARFPQCVKENETRFVSKKLPKKSKIAVAKPKKNCYIKTTNETKTTKTGDNYMMNKNEIAKIAPNAVKNILAAQKTNKTDTKKTYWGGWAKVRRGMNAAYNDYDKYQNLETEWLELRQKLGGTKSPLYHFCWKLINSNRVGVKQEPNATLRFIKNAKIRIAMANDVLVNKKKYKNEIAENWKATFGTEI